MKVSKLFDKQAHIN